jgi:hypothetical protein
MSSPGVNHENPNNFLWSYHLTSTISARICAVIALVLCAGWASFDYPNFLNAPSWKSNLFAWHPVLMICGFFFSQIFAITSWGTFPAKYYHLEKFQHTLWQLAACATMVAGLIVSTTPLSNSRFHFLTPKAFATLVYFCM